MADLRLELAQPPRRYLREHFALTRDRLAHHDVEGADTISCDEKHSTIIDCINVADLAPAKPREGQVSPRHQHQTRSSSSEGTAAEPASIGSITSERNSSTCCDARPA